MDSKGRLLEFNTAFCTLLGYSPAPPSQLSIFDIVEDRNENVRANLEHILRDRDSASFSGERIYRRADNTLVPVTVILAAVKRDGKDAVLAIARQSNAAGAELRLQEALTNAAAQWRQTFDAIANPILVLDEDLRILRMNVAARDYLGSGFGALLNTRIPSSPAAPWLDIAECVSAALTTQQAQSRRACDAAQRQLQITVTPGSGNNTVVLLHDMTDLHQLQESLRRSEVMSAMGLLVAGVAHEVRNPLFSISALTEAFELKFGFTAEQAPYIAHLRRELDRMNRLMNDLLAYGKTRVTNKQNVDLVPLIYTALDLSGPLLREQKIKVHFDSPEAALASLDSTRIVDAIHNLVENAAQHSPPAGEIELHLDEGKAELVLSVRDHGPGFSAEALQRAFEPFYSKRSGGTGLGLPIVQRILLEHKGEVTAANHPQGGAVVTLTIPRDAA